MSSYLLDANIIIRLLTGEPEEGSSIELRNTDCWLSIVFRAQATLVACGGLGRSTAQTL